MELEAAWYHRPVTLGFVHFRTAWATPVDSLPGRQSSGLELTGIGGTRDLVPFFFFLSFLCYILLLLLLLLSLSLLF